MAILPPGNDPVEGDAIWTAAGDIIQGTGANAAEVLSIGSANEILAVNAGATALEYVSSLFDGWVSAKETWTFASASTFTITGDITTTYQAGTKLKWTQTSVRFGVVISSSFGGGNTTVVIAVNDDFVIDNAVITNNFYSYVESPQGFPGYFNYTPAISSSAGSITSYTITTALYQINGQTIRIEVEFVITDGGNGSGGIIFTVPVSGDGRSVGAGRENALTGNELQIFQVTTTNVSVLNFDNSYPGGTNAELICTVDYFF